MAPETKRHLTPGADGASQAARHSVSWLAIFLASACILFGVATPRALGADSVGTDSATAVHHTSAVLNGHLEPEPGEEVTTCVFDWGTSVSYGNTIPCAEGNIFAEAEDVSASLGGLQPGTTYHYRLSATTGTGNAVFGADASFTLVPFPIGRRDLAQLGPDGTPSSIFPGEGGSAGPTQLAFDQSRSRLYAFSPSTPGIYGYDTASFPTVTPLPGFDPLPTPNGGESTGLAVDPRSGDVYLASAVQNNEAPQLVGTGEVYGYGPDGTPLGGHFPINPLTNPGGLATDPLNSESVCGVGVDPAGNIWVGVSNTGLIEYDSSGVFIRSVATARTLFEAPPCRIAFDSNGDVYFSLNNGAARKLFAPEYDKEDRVSVGQEIGTDQVAANGLTVDSQSHHVFTVERSQIDEFDFAGNFLSAITDDVPGDTYAGVAVDPSNDDVYAADSSSKQIHVFGPPQPRTYPTVTYLPASRITDTSARLRALVDPEGQGPVSECKFEWGKTKALGSSTPCSPAPGAGSGNVAVSADLVGLSPATSYDFRIRAANGSGTALGQEGTFTTTELPPAISDIETLEATAITNTSVRLRGTLNPAESAVSECHFAYGADNSYGHTATCSPPPGSGTQDVPVAALVTGLTPNTTYHFQLQAGNSTGISAGEDVTFTTRGPATVETEGAPFRSATTARLQGRLDPHGAPTGFHFEYGLTDAYGESTPEESAGSGTLVSFGAATIDGLTPGTTYHYRMVADNGNPAGPGVGGDRTFATWGSEAPLSHGAFAGPPGSDRAWELVSAADASGNPVGGALGFSDSGERALYAVAGGLPGSQTGSLASQFFAQRTESSPHVGGWQTSFGVYPPRSQLVGPDWLPPGGSAELSTYFAANFYRVSSAVAMWKLSPGGVPRRLTSVDLKLTPGSGSFVTSFYADDGSRAVLDLRGAFDPAFPHVKQGFYDFSSGSARLLSVLPGGEPAAVECEPAELSAALPTGEVTERSIHWITPDGSRLLIPSPGAVCGGPMGLYVRNLQTEETERISPPPISGPSCDVALIRSTSSSAYFWTQSRLTADDVAPAGCNGNTRTSPALGGDVYRFDFASHTLECVTCVVAGADVSFPTSSSEEGGGNQSVAIADDGSRLYFASPNSLLPGAPPSGFYRLDIGTGDLAFVAPGAQSGGVGLAASQGEALSPDGTTLVFESRNPELDQTGGTNNGGILQYYLYNDQNRSLTCVSCAPDGAAPVGPVPKSLLGTKASDNAPGPNLSPVDATGAFAFTTPTPLVSADHNTAGAAEEPYVGDDVYEWRDGRILLVSDGATAYQGGALGGQVPTVQGFTPSGRDLFLTAPAAWTSEAPDAFTRLYDARVGGGFLGPSASSPPCELQDCQGVTKAPPEDPQPRIAQGPGNPKPVSCKKGFVRRGGKCMKKSSRKKGRDDKHRKRAKKGKGHRKAGHEQKTSGNGRRDSR